MPQCPRCAAEVPPVNRYCGSCGASSDASISSETVSLSYGAAARLSAVAVPEEGRFPPGTILSQRYRIASRLGKGGMGDVYRATDLLIGQTVALKFLPERLTGSEPAIERLRCEVRLARQISHPNVCRVYDIGSAAGQLFLTMEFIDGEDLATLLRRIGRLPPAKALEVSRHLCAGLAAAHDKGVLHRDLKPGNVMIDGRGQVFITDFGLAALAGSVSLGDIRSGTPEYMAPEQKAGVAVTARSDIYSLGLVMYELYMGAQPVHSSDTPLIEVREAGCESLMEIDPAVAAVVAQCLAPDPSKRPPSPLAVAAALPGGDPLAAALAAGETPSPDVVAAAGSAETMRPVLANICFSVLLLTVIAVLWLTTRTSLLSLVAADMEPGGMIQTARDILADLGYESRTGWAGWGFTLDDSAIDRLAYLDRTAAQKRAAEARPIHFWYRTSNRALAGAAPSRFFAVTERDPPVSAPGMISVRLETNRSLSSLQAVPAEQGSALEGSAAFDWMRLFRAARLDSSRFTPVDPVWTPPSAFDARAAWLEAGAVDPLRIEAAAWHGRPVYFRTGPNSTTAPAARPTGGFNLRIAYRFFIDALIILLAWRNLRAGRGDLRGAKRVAVFAGATIVLGGIVMASHSADFREWELLRSITGDALWVGAVSALAYLAVEPFVRRHSPHALIAWTRLLNGRFRDPLVGQHVLFGLMFGAAVVLSIKVFGALHYGIDGPGWYLAAAQGGPIPAILGTLVGAANAAAQVFCLLLVATAVLRNQWLGAGGIAIAATAVTTGGGPHWQAEAALSLVLYSAGMFFALRYGLLASVSAAFTIEALRNFPLTLNSSAWYFNVSLTVVLLVIALGAWAYRSAVTPGRRAHGLAP